MLYWRREACDWPQRLVGRREDGQVSAWLSCWAPRQTSLGPRALVAWLSFLAGGLSCLGRLPAGRDWQAPWPEWLSFHKSAWAPWPRASAAKLVARRSAKLVGNAGCQWVT